MIFLSVCCLLGSEQYRSFDLLGLHPGFTHLNFSFCFEIEDSVYVMFMNYSLLSISAF